MAKKCDDTKYNALLDEPTISKKVTTNLCDEVLLQGIINLDLNFKAASRDFSRARSYILYHRYEDVPLLFHAYADFLLKKPLKNIKSLFKKQERITKVFKKKVIISIHPAYDLNRTARRFKNKFN